MVTFGQHPSEQDAKVQNKQNVTARTKRPSAEGQLGNPLNDDTTKAQSFHAQGSTEQIASSLFRLPHPGASAPEIDEGLLHSLRDFLSSPLGEIYGEVTTTSRSCLLRKFS